MQVMPDTADFVNQRFDQSYDIDAYRDNATLGANYLAWLIKYIGDAFFDGAYGVSAEDCTTELNSCLLNAVISAYNFGPGAVVTDDGLKIPNPQYVRNVRALMTNCVCLNYGRLSGRGRRRRRGSRSAPTRPPARSAGRRR